MHPVIQPPFEPIPAPESRPTTAPVGMNFRVARSLRMHRKAAVVVALVALVALIGFALSRRPLYEAESLIYIQPTAAKLVTDTTSGFYDSSRYDSYVQQQLETLKRDDILTGAIEKLPPGYWRHPGESMQTAVARLQANLKVERVQGSYEISVSLKGANPQLIAEVVNQVTAAYLKKGRGDELAPSEQQLQLLTAERQRVQEDLTKDRQEQAGLSTTLGVADTTADTGNPYDVDLAEMRKQVAAAKSDHEIAVARLASVDARGTDSAGAVNAATDEMVSNDPSLSKLKSAIAERRMAVTSQMAGLTPTNPVYKQDEQELVRLDKALDVMSADLRVKAVQQLRARLKLEVDRTADIDSRLESQLARQTAVATGAAPKLQRAADLAADIKRLQDRFTETDNAIHSIELQESSAGLAHLSLAATVPQDPAPSKRLFILAMALPLALGAGVAAAVLLQKLDAKVYIADDVQHALRFQPMAVLPNPKEVPDAVMEEFLLRLVGGIDDARRSGGAETYVFTAASRSTDIKPLLRHLANRMDKMGYCTMVVPASAALSGVRPPDSESALRTEMRLKRGVGSQLATTGRSSHVLDRLEQLKESVDLVFIDALPILTSAETEFVSRLANITVVIAESGKTTQEDLKDAFALVQRLGASGVSTVLVDVALQNGDENFLSAVRSADSRQTADGRMVH